MKYPFLTGLIFLLLTGASVAQDSSGVQVSSFETFISSGPANEAGEDVIFQGRISFSGTDLNHLRLFLEDASGNLLHEVQVLASDKFGITYLVVNGQYFELSPVTDIYFAVPAEVVGAWKKTRMVTESNMGIKNEFEF